MKSFFTCLAGALVAGCACAAPVNVLFDTDMYTDYDDVGALAMLHALADADECRILAIGCNTWGEGNRSVAACEVINAYYGRPDIPVGCARHGGREGKGAEGHGLPAKYPQGVRHLVSTNAPPAVDTYLGVLRTVPDKTVVLCSVGFLNNVADLLKADRELVSRKVKADDNGQSSLKHISRKGENAGCFAEIARHIGCPCIAAAALAHILAEQEPAEDDGKADRAKQIADNCTNEYFHGRLFILSKILTKIIARLRYHFKLDMLIFYSLRAPASECRSRRNSAYFCRKDCLISLRE